MNSPSRPFRLILAAALGIALLLLLAALLFVTENLLSVWAYLESYPLWIRGLFGGILLLISLLGGVLVWRLLLPAKPNQSDDQRKPTPPTEEELEQRIELAREQGIPIERALTELSQLHQRRQAGSLHIALFGEISAGKSSVVAALLPEAEVIIGASGGTTRDIRQYEWHSTAGDRLILTDMPGLNEAGGPLNEMAQAEALRAHLVIYLVDGDLTRDQYHELQQLLSLNKPLLLALNKVDRYSEQQLDQIKTRLQERLEGAERVELVTLSSGGEQEVMRLHPDGREELITRQRPPRIDELAQAIQRQLDSDPAALNQLRDAAVFVLIDRQLESAERQHRHDEGERLIKSYTRKAMIGAMAAVTPGTDLLVQGYLGYHLLRDLCALHGVPLRKLDSDRLIEQVRGQVGKSLPLLLAVAGNGFKAFPGIGTLTGGLLQAVAYGLIFDSLGKAVAKTLEGRGELATGPAVQLFKETLGEDLEKRARALARLALDTRRNSE